MREWESQAHVRWDCKYHVVFVPKYRRTALYGNLRRDVGRILRDPCRQRGVELIEGHAMPDHVHLCLARRAEVQRGEHGRVPQGQERRPHPPRAAARAADVWPALLGRRVLREHGRLDEATVRQYIREQEELDGGQGHLNFE